MKWCPKCKKFDMEYDSNIGHYRCLWRDCSFVNLEDIDLDKAFDQYIRIHGTQFKGFSKYLDDKSAKKKVVV